MSTPKGGKMRKFFHPAWCRCERMAMTDEKRWVTSELVLSFQTQLWAAQLIVARRGEVSERAYPSC